MLEPDWGAWRGEVSTSQSALGSTVYWPDELSAFTTLPLQVEFSFSPPSGQAPTSLHLTPDPLDARYTQVSDRGDQLDP